ncbi:uncharacterized protein LOC113566515 [Drosophila persimilis]|uniref:uncharacterized protein LOC113566515 n=1 Tax=Drosophila persimilis TaxID=7234 RepID=UPI000F085AF1|nr:uncharacterized protein LOC113566515 [Drosophila persimilis]
MCFYDQFVLATQNDWRIESNEPCQWPTNDCHQILNEKRHRTSLTSRKAKKHRRLGAHKNASKSMQHSRVQKHHKTERRDSKEGPKLLDSSLPPIKVTPSDQIYRSSETPKIPKVTSWTLLENNHHTTEKPVPWRRRGRQSRSKGKKHRKTESKPRAKIQPKKETEIDVRETMFQ